MFQIFAFIFPKNGKDSFEIALFFSLAIYIYIYIYIYIAKTPYSKIKIAKIKCFILRFSIAKNQSHFNQNRQNYIQDSVE